jgi:hypothetical protein
LNRRTDYAHRHNIENFRGQLAEAADEKQKAVLRKLLAEELAEDDLPSVE